MINIEGNQNNQPEKKIVEGSTEQNIEDTNAIKIEDLPIDLVTKLKEKANELEINPGEKIYATGPFEPTTENGRFTGRFDLSIFDGNTFHETNVNLEFELDEEFTELMTQLREQWALYITD